MTKPPLKLHEKYVIERADFQELFDVLLEEEYDLKGPTVTDEGLKYDDIASTEDLPVGLTDEQEGGRYRLVETEEDKLFGYVHGQDSWKKYLYPSELEVFSAQETEEGDFEIEEEPLDCPKYAFVGVRSCDLHAITVHDRVFTTGPHTDPHYQSRRQNMFVVSVDCTNPGNTCFCRSMETGPEARAGFDINLTEVIQDGRHYFLAEAGTAEGAEILSRVPQRRATEVEEEHAREEIEQAKNSMGRSMRTDGLKDLLYDHVEHPRWEDVASRCLTCGNCTNVCPTCFCATIEDRTSLDGSSASRVRLRDWCYSKDFSYIHGGPLRDTALARYRQWMTHKLAYWKDQFDVFGCIGCGRCITWCPVGIDITEEVSAHWRAEGEDDRAREAE